MSAQASQRPCKHHTQANPHRDTLPARLFVCGHCGAFQRLDLSRYGRRSTDDLTSRLSDCAVCGASRHEFEPVCSSSVPMAVLS
jgi:hypothetical protein